MRWQKVQTDKKALRQAWSNSHTRKPWKSKLHIDTPSPLIGISSSSFNLSSISHRKTSFCIQHTKSDWQLNQVGNVAQFLFPPTKRPDVRSQQNPISEIEIAAPQNTHRRTRILRRDRRSNPDHASPHMPLKSTPETFIERRIVISCVATKRRVLNTYQGLSKKNLN